MSKITTVLHDKESSIKHGFMPLITALHSEVINNFNLDIHPNDLILTTSLRSKSSQKQLFDGETRGYFLSMHLEIGSTRINIATKPGILTLFFATVDKNGSISTSGSSYFLDKVLKVSESQDEEVSSKQILEFFLKEYAESKESVLSS